ncbi:MAG: recombinase family protein [Clostridiales bacterium]|nr:recombinase family protein [Clostridiales bacterium]
MGNVYGYVLAFGKQNPGSEYLDALKKLKVPSKNIFVDETPGREESDQPMLQKLTRKLDKGDLLYIQSLSWLGFNYRDIMERWRLLTKDKKVDVDVLDMPLLDTRRDRELNGSLVPDLVTEMLQYVWQNDRIRARERQATGIARARARGVRCGRPPIPLPENFDQICERWEAGEISRAQAASESGMSQASFWRKMKQRQARQEGGEDRGDCAV